MLHFFTNKITPKISLQRLNTGRNNAGTKKKLSLKVKASCCFHVCNWQWVQNMCGIHCQIIMYRFIVTWSLDNLQQKLVGLVTKYQTQPKGAAWIQWVTTWKFDTAWNIKRINVLNPSKWQMLLPTFQLNGLII